MKTFVEILFAAQATLKRFPASSREHQAELTHLREKIPAPVLAHFLRLVEQGREGVTLVRHGVCSGCHLRVASGIVAALARPMDLHLCENCGSYLLLPPEELPAAQPRVAPSVSVARRARRSPRALAA